jgi:type II secretory pathway component PulJ
MTTSVFLWVGIATLAWLVGVLHARVRRQDQRQAQMQRDIHTLEKHVCALLDKAHVHHGSRRGYL